MVESDLVESQEKIPQAIYILLSRMLCWKDPGGSMSAQYKRSNRLRGMAIKGKPVAGILWMFMLN